MQNRSRWLTFFLLIFLAITVSLPSGRLQAATIHVPTDQPTIQAAINAAANGDIVLVAPGTCHENIHFQDKVLKVANSSSGLVQGNTVGNNNKGSCAEGDGMFIGACGSAWIKGGW